MKILNIWLALYLAFGAAQVQAGDLDLKITFKSIKNPTALLWVAVFDEKSHFLVQGKAVKVGKVQPQGSQGILQLKGFRPGTYAVAVYQDTNSNERLDQNFLGIPKEPYGFSNDATGVFGPPSFDDSSIQLTGNRSIEINLR